MKSYMFCALKMLVAVFLIQSAVAQEPNQNKKGVEISSEKIEQLITTLESETARKEFIDNLKTLTAVENSEKEGDLPSVTDFLGLDETSDSLSDRYVATLDSIGKKIGLSGTMVSNIIYVLIAFFILLILVMLNKWLANFLNGKFDTVRNKFNLSPTRFSLYFKIQVWFGYFLGFSLFTYALSEIFELTVGRDDINFIEILMEYIFTLFVLVILFVSIWEVVNGIIEWAKNKFDAFDGSRMNTLLPIIRNLLLFVLVALSILTVLSEFGIDIMPLLAGAGVLGIAVGFGAQTLVKDFLTGFIIIFEDLLQVGDVVKLGDRLGSVELITIRKIQLRDLDGTVHTIPFSEVSIVDNLTKEFSYYLFEVGVAYREDTDEVVECLKTIGEDLEASDEYKELILAPLEILGVDHFADSAVIIKARIKTRAHDKWIVGREFNRRMKHAFDEQQIEIPFPHQTIYFGEDKEGNAPRAPIKLIEKEQDDSSDSSSQKNKKQNADKKNGIEKNSGKSSEKEDVSSDNNSSDEDG